MDFFSGALLSDKTDKIPEVYDWFAPLIGDWDCDYYDEPEKGHKRHVVGEWIFRRILEGTGVQDVFIFPSRSTKAADPQPDGEYGTSLRMFNKKNGCYDVVYTCETCIDEENAFWVFSDMTPDHFHWENVLIREDGTKELVCEIFGKRIG